MRIMVVDNDTSLTRSLEILLTDRGHEVAGFDDPRRAAETIEQGIHPEVLILDYCMPQMSGQQFLQRLRLHLRPDCRIILLSGHLDDVPHADLVRLGVSSFLPKPPDLNAICGQVAFPEVS